MSDIDPPGNGTTDASEGAIQNAWSASSAVREFSGTHRTIRGLIHIFRLAVTAAQPGDEKRTRAVAKALAVAVEGTRFHHSLEDNDYWPALIANGADRALIEPLMVEHHELDPILDSLDKQAQALAAKPTDELALSSSKELFVNSAEHLLTHLDHEEPIFFPLLAQYLSDREARTLSLKAGKSAPRTGFSWIMARAPTPCVHRRPTRSWVPFPSQWCGFARCCYAGTGRTARFSALNRPGIPGGSIPWKRGWSKGEEADIEAVSA